jgi:hypothetical protein
VLVFDVEFKLVELFLALEYWGDLDVLICTGVYGVGLNAVGFTELVLLLFRFVNMFLLMRLEFTLIFEVLRGFGLLVEFNCWVLRLDGIRLLFICKFDYV